jgi:hypothetical protein
MAALNATAAAWSVRRLKHQTQDAPAAGKKRNVRDNVRFRSWFEPLSEFVRNELMTSHEGPS